MDRGVVTESGGRGFYQASTGIRLLLHAEWNARPS
jgi:hypothetical protein